MEPNNRRNCEEWMRVFSDWRESRESQRGYCRREDIPYSSFTYWRRKLDQERNDNSLVKVSNLAALPEIGRKVLTVRVGKIQVELAQLLYLLPRLTGRGIMLSRLGGGIGTRGPGEQKLEVDRRRIRVRITKLKKELAQFEFIGIAKFSKQGAENLKKVY